MARTKRNPMSVPKARDAIRATQLMNRLVDHGLSKIDLKSTQVEAIKVVLRKLIPDLQTVAVGQSEDHGPVQITWKSKA